MMKKTYFWMCLSALCMMINVCHGAEKSDTKTAKEESDQEDETRISNAACLVPSSLTIYKDGVVVSQFWPVSLTKNTSQKKIFPVATSVMKDSLSVMNTATSHQSSILETRLHQKTKEDPYTLSLTLKALENSPHNRLSLMYIAKNMTWTANYAIRFSQGYKTIGLDSWIDVTNNTGVDFKQATLKFVDAKIPTTDGKIKLTKWPRSYTGFAITDMTDQTTKRLHITSTDMIQTKQDYRVIVGGKYLEDMNNKSASPIVETWVTFLNTKENGLGVDLPYGTATLYYQTNEQQADIIGVADVTRTKEGQEISVKIPSLSFDTSHEPEAKSIETVLEQNQFTRVDESINNAHYKLDLKNNSSEPVTVRVMLDMPPNTVRFEIIRKTQEYQSADADSVCWNVSVPAKQTVTLKYQVQYITAPEVQ